MAYDMDTLLGANTPVALLAEASVTPAAAGAHPKSILRQPDEDEDLLRRIGEQDEAALRELVARHGERAHAVALKILRNPADADDVVQDVMLRIWTKSHMWQPGEAKFSTWLHRIVTNRCLDLHRRPRTETIDNAPDVADEQPDALTAMQRGEVSDLLERAMAHVPDQQRIALILSYIDSFSNAEIAGILDTSVTAVESLLKRGRVQLRLYLQNSEGAIRETFTDS